jgi:hypothetical protein
VSESETVGKAASHLFLKYIYNWEQSISNFIFENDIKPFLHFYSLLF